MSETKNLTGPIIRELEKRKIFAMRLNSGMAKIGKYYVRLCPPGTADIAIYPPFQLPIWVETKMPRDLKRKGSTADAQGAFRATVEMLGHQYLRVTTVKEVLDAVA